MASAVSHIASPTARRDSHSPTNHHTASIDLDSAGVGARLADDATMLGKRGRVALRTDLVEVAGRALDIGEEERHRAAGQRGLARA